jgi:hypothetical protein
MKLVKYISMLLVMLISNVNQEDLKAQSQVASSDSIYFQINKDITLCDSDLMEFIAPNGKISPGYIAYNEAYNNRKSIENATFSSLKRDPIEISNTKSESDSGFNVSTMFSLLNKAGLTINGKYDNSKSAKLEMEFKGTEIATIADIDSIIYPNKEKLLKANFTENPIIYRSVVYATGIKYKFQKSNNNKGGIGFNVAKLKVTGTGFTKNVQENSLEKDFGRSLGVLFCKTDITKERIEATSPPPAAKKKYDLLPSRAVNPKKIVKVDLPAPSPSIKYKVVLQDKGAGNYTSEESDGSGLLKPYTGLVYQFSARIENKRSICTLKFRSKNKNHVENNFQSDGSTSGTFGLDLIGINAYLENCPENWRINYQINVNDKDSCWDDNAKQWTCNNWQNWVCNKDEFEASNWAEIPGSDWNKYHVRGLKFKITTDGQCLQGNQ